MKLMTGTMIAAAGLLALGLGLGAAPAVAAGASEAQEQTALMNSKLSLSEAIATAERQTGGKAFDAGVDVDHGKPLVQVEINGPKGVQTVTIDASNGQVIGVRSGGVPD